MSPRRKIGRGEDRGGTWLPERAATAAGTASYERAGRPIDEELVKGVRRPRSRWSPDPPPRWVPRAVKRSVDLVPEFARRSHQASTCLRGPLERAGDRPPSGRWPIGPQVANVAARSASRAPCRPSRGAGDDVRYSGWTRADGGRAAAAKGAVGVPAGGSRSRRVGARLGRAACIGSKRAHAVRGKGRFGCVLALPRWRAAPRTDCRRRRARDRCSAQRFALPVGAQVCAGSREHGVLTAAWPGVTRRRAWAWMLCGSGLSGPVLRCEAAGGAIGLPSATCATRRVPGLQGRSRPRARSRRSSACDRARRGQARGRTLSARPSRCSPRWRWGCGGRSSASRCARTGDRARGRRGGLRSSRRPLLGGRVLPADDRTAACGRRRRRASCWRSGCPRAPRSSSRVGAEQGSAPRSAPRRRPRRVGAALLVAVPLDAGQPVVPRRRGRATRALRRRLLRCAGRAIASAARSCSPAHRSPRALLREVRAIARQRRRRPTIRRIEDTST